MILQWTFSGHKFRIKKYLLIVKNDITFFTIGNEKVFDSKNCFFAKNLLFKAMPTSHLR